jgi:hypothetical protein
MVSFIKIPDRKGSCGHHAPHLIGRGKRMDELPWAQPFSSNENPTRMQRRPRSCAQLGLNGVYASDRPADSRSPRLCLPAGPTQETSEGSPRGILFAVTPDGMPAKAGVRRGASTFPSPVPQGVDYPHEAHLPPQRLTFRSRSGPGVCPHRAGPELDQPGTIEGRL